jgi:DNA-binding NtrC family response regulator
LLETGGLRRLGGNGDVSVKVRVVALTLRDLPREVERGAFRLDLYHRLAGFELTLPPLRSRRGDVAGLARHFLGELQRELGPRTIDGAALARLVGHSWPGNVRELRNVLRRAALVSPRHIGAEALDLPRGLPSLVLVDRAAEPGAVELGTTWGCGARLPALAEPDPPGEPPPPGRPAGEMAAPAAAPVEARAPGAAERRPGPEWPDGVLDIRGLTFEQIERYVYGWALQRHGGSRRKAARALGIARSTFCDKVKRFGLGQAASAATPAGTRE